ncbi:DUF6541 family protein [Specibacter sp. NPDC078692]|uniref:DUF6541 family protein n=1 Tax=Specibacter sp. NPDC078692 TaxID=3155818 RepID=UPI003439A846
MTWWQALPAVCTAAALLFIPGFILSRGLGAKAYSSLAFAPLASCGLIGVAGIIGGITGIPWSVWLLGGVTLLATAVGWGLHRLLRPRLAPMTISSEHKVLSWVTTPVVLLVSAMMVAKRLTSAMGSPDSFAQVYDNIFHLNAIRFIMETGNASTLTMGNMLTGNSGLSLYPSVWHSLAALTAELTSVNVFVAENALTIAVSALVWPFACIALVRGLLGPRIVPMAIAGVLSTSFWIFPYQTIQWGPLFPNTLAYSILPVAILTVAGLFGLTKERMANHFTLIAMLLVGIAAMFLTQPNGFSALLAFTLPMAVGLTIKTIRRAWRSDRRLRNLLVTVSWIVGVALVFVTIWTALLLGYDDWKPSRTFVEAVKDVLTGGLLGKNFTWLASLLAAVGFVTILMRRRGWWLLGCMTVAGFLYVVAAWAQPGSLRHVVTGSWYQDPYRLAALVPLFTIVLAATGADGVVSAIKRAVDWLTKGNQVWSRRLLISPSARSRAVGGLLVLTLVLTAFVPLALHANSKGMKMVTKKISQSWSYDPGWIVSSPEYELMSRLDEDVPADAVIAVDPFNGGSLAYAISGRKVTQFHLNPAPSKDLAEIAQGLDTATAGSEVCRLVTKENIHFVLDFGSFYMLDTPAAKKYPAFVEIRDSPTLKLVDQQDHAKLYEIVGC